MGQTVSHLSFASAEVEGGVAPAGTSVLSLSQQGWNDDIQSKTVLCRRCCSDDC